MITNDLLYKLKLIGACVFASVLIVALLYAMSDKINNHSNGFSRSFRNTSIVRINELNLKYNSYYIAGTGKENFYLGNSVNPFHLIAANYILTDTLHLRLKISDISVQLPYARVTVSVDSPNIHLMENISPAIYHGFLSHPVLIRLADSVHFSTSVPISRKSFAYRIIDRYSDNYELAKEITDPYFFRVAPEILERQSDGIFSVDGMLHYNAPTGNLVYIYYYRNEFICMDTSLNILYREQTIDTTRIANIKFSYVESQKRISLSAPPLTVNKLSCVNDEWILIHSSLLADNEDQESFKNHSVIDVYSIDHGQYQFSFYLPKYKNNAITDFRAHDNIIVALYGRHLQTFRIN